jgi:hypothetical protein
MTFEEKGNGTTIRLVETVYLYLIQIDFDSKVTEFFHNDLGLRNVGEFVWTESLGRSLGAMEGGVFGTPSADSWTLLKRSTQGPGGTRLGGIVSAVQKTGCRRDSPRRLRETSSLKRL